MPHRGSGDRSLCESYDDSQSGLGFTSLLLYFSTGQKTVVVVFFVFFFSVNVFKDTVVKIHQHHCKEYLKIYKLAKLQK